MNYTGSMILFIFLVQLAAYTLKWLIGFGNPLISAPVSYTHLTLPTT